MNPELSGSENELTPATDITGTEIAAESISAIEESKVNDSSNEVITESIVMETPHEDEAELHEQLDEELPDFSVFSKVQLLDAIKNTASKTTDEATVILKAIKPVLDSILQDEYNSALHTYTEEGGEKDDFEYKDKDNAREIFNAAFKDIKNKKAEERARQESERKANLAKKNAILDQLKQLAEDEETEGSLKKLKELQNEFKNIRNVPKEESERLWESYHLYIHKFYDRLSIFNELKDLDRKKNLDHKIELIQKVSELALEPSSKRASIMLKKFQEEWKSIGPVPQESNEEIWNRFKLESDKIFEMIKAVQEQNQKVREENLSLKKELLAKALELSNYSTDKIKDWFEKTNVANQLMEEWKKIGMVPLKYRESLWNEFRNARNTFYSNKNNFFKKLQAERSANLKAKQALCEKAEAIAAQPIDFVKQTDEIKRLQEEWKKVGPVPEKVADAIWKKFRAACDLFFEKKSANYSSQIEEQKSNLETKNRIIAELESLLAKEADSDILKELKSLQDEWNNTGYVPMNEKEKVNKKYSQLNDQVFQKFKQVSSELREMKETSHFEAMLNSPNGDQKIKREERFLIDKIRGLRNDIYTWENNLGFFSKGNSKSENPMIKQIQDKIDQANKNLEQLDRKLKTVRSYLKQATKN